MIKIFQYNLRATSIYPGIYEPPFTKEQEPIKLKGSKPPVNIIEFPDHYEIEMPAPGYKKEDFFIKTGRCSLLIVVNKRLSNTMNDARYRHHGFYFKYIAKSVELPADADTEFGTAEYKNGILYIYLYKTSYPAESHQGFIIVY